MKKKIFTHKEVSKKISILKKNKKKIVLCHGVFDLVHYGHILHLNSAKKFGDFLIVSVTSDKFVNKGPGKPLFSQFQRMHYLSNLEMIDGVILSNTASAIDVLKLIRPNIYVKGPDYIKTRDDKTKKILLEKNLVKTFGGEIKYTEDKAYSSSSIINSTGLIYNQDQRKFLDKIKTKFGKDFIINKINELKKLNLLIIGELIFDDYNFGNIIGKSGKEPHLVFEKKFNEIYVGGSGAIARHLSSFLKKIYLISFFGKEAFYNKILKQNLNKNIQFLNRKPNKNFKSIVKSRFVDINSSYKMFGSYLLPDEINSQYYLSLKNDIKKTLKKIDHIIIADYGHNLLPKTISDLLIKSKKFVSVNCQINSSNITHQNLSKYIGVDLFVINESELRYDLRDKITKIETLMKTFSKNQKIKNLIVTRGKNGSIYFGKKKFYYCPAFAIKSVDKVGAGDAMLSLTSSLLRNKIDPQIALFVGSLASSIIVQSPGNKVSVQSSNLERIIEFILK
ncbi:MAG: transposase [Flavobacteriales bacterium]|nr:transposase [Flavobacteriales bacterium]|tara:strand:+ start:29 stop:1546 length:1518 start_codon:yes stop_codon:yes gene_type:complete